MGLPRWLSSKDAPANAGDARDADSPLGREDPMEKEMVTTPGFLPGKFHRQGSLAGCSPWCCKESNMTEHARTGRSAVLCVFMYVCVSLGEEVGVGAL